MDEDNIKGLHRSDIKHNESLSTAEQIAIRNPDGTRVNERDMDEFHRGGQTDYSPEQMEAPFFEGIKGGHSEKELKTLPSVHPSNWIIGTRIITVQNTLQVVGQPVEVLTPLQPDEYGFGRKALSVYNNSAGVVYISGDFNMANAGMGWIINPNSSYTFDKEASCGLWVNPTVAGTDIRLIIEMGFMGYRVVPRMGYA